MDFSIFHSIWTVLIALLLVGIIVWAFAPSRREYFEDVGRKALDDDDHPASGSRSK